MSVECVQLKEKARFIKTTQVQAVEPLRHEPLWIDSGSNHDLLLLWRSTNRRYRTARHNWRVLLNHHVKPGPKN